MKYPLQSTLTAVFITFCGFAVFVPQANAEDDVIRNSDNAIWGSVGANLLGYKEPSPPPYLSDSERDWIPSIAAGVSLLGDEDLYFAIDGSLSYGDAHYNGAYFYFPTTPLQSTTRETISTINGKIGRSFSLDSNVLLIPYVELGFRYWDRNLGGGEVEDYKNFDALGGAMLQISPTDNLILSVYGSGGTTFSPRMSTEGDTYDLGDSAMYKVGGKIGYDIAERTEIFTTLDYEHFSYGQSSVLSDDTYEPNSHTNETALRVGIAYHFQ